MFTNRTQSLARTATLAAVLGASVFGAAGIAAATTQDSAFLHALDSEGIPYSTADNAVQLGHHICGEFGSGATFSAIVDEGLTQSTYSADQVGFIVGDAVGAYCPQHADQIPR